MNQNSQGGQGSGMNPSGFRALAARSRPRALQVLNNLSLTFPTLYLLAPEIRRFNLYQGQIPRNLIALKIVARKQNDPELTEKLAQMLPAQGEEIRSGLIWMLRTGASWDGPHPLYDPYDAAIDAAAARLIGEYGDTSTLPLVTDLIFRRNRQGLLIHDLVWGFFQSANVESMTLVAEYLLSPEQEDFELACKLLHLPLPGGDLGPAGRRSIFEDFLAWLRENTPYLYFTGEHFQETSDPTPIKLDPGAKYLGKAISPESKRFFDALSEPEENRLQEFLRIAPAQQEKLSAYSDGLRKADPAAWQVWMDQSPGVQAAAMGFEGGIFG